MEILAHRGLWKTQEDRNTINSIYLALDKGFGIETDIRDFNGKLVISHNIADELCPSVEEVFKIYSDKGYKSQLALNVKADGIQDILKPLLEKYHISNYFLFDMSIPELVVYEREKFNYYTRQSDIENVGVMYKHANGVWLDSFYDEHWITSDIIENHLAHNKQICIVSPELHGYTYEETWKMMKENKYYKSDLVSLCTDKPDLARSYFNE